MKRVFIMRFSALGDVAMTIPAVYGVAIANPDVSFVYYTFRRFTELFMDRPDNLKVVGLDSIKTGKVFRFMKDQIDRLKPNCMADLHNVGRTWLVDAYACLKGVRLAMVDKSRLSRSRDLKHKIQQVNFIDRYRQVLAALGLSVADAEVSFDMSRVELPVQVSTPCVGIAPFARYATKVYPLHLMEEVIAGLSMRNVNVYLFGGRGSEQSQLELWATRYPNCHSLAGKHSLRQEMSVMASLQVMLSMDSANQHICSLVGTKVLTLWGGTSPSCGFAPYRQPSDRAIQTSVECHPCSIAGTSKCPRNDFQCMESIQPINIVDRIINEL